MSRLEAYLLKVSRYRVSGPVDESDELIDPTIEEVERFLRSVDGRTFDQVVVELEMAGGSRATVNVDGNVETSGLSIDEPNFRHMLFNPSVAGDQVTVMPSGGTSDEVPTRYVLPLHVVVDAVLIFLRTGKLDDKFCWCAIPSRVRRR